MVAEVEEAAHLATLELVVGAQWQVHRVSPLWGVPYTAGGAAREEEGMGACPNVRRLVGEQEGQEVYDRKALARLGKAMAEVVGGQVEVRIEPLPGLRGTRFDSEALQVVVEQGMAGSRVEVFQGILCSVEAEELVLQSTEATNLPVLLTRGAADTTELVVAGLERCFDCVVGRLELGAGALQWMAAMWAGFGEELGEGGGKGGAVKLVYGLPDSLAHVRKQVSHFTFEFGAAEVRRIWRACREVGSSEELGQGEMEAFHRALALHLRRTLGVRVDRLELVQVQLPFLRVHQGGRLAVAEVARVKTVLRFLTELCQGGVLGAAPTLAMDAAMEEDTISMNHTFT